MADGFRDVQQHLEAIVQRLAALEKAQEQRVDSLAKSNEELGLSYARLAREIGDMAHSTWSLQISPPSRGPK